MKNDELIGEVLDYLEFRNRLESDQYWGMASSQRPELFYKFFDSLDESAKNDLSHIMVTAALGQLAELQRYVLHILLLISGLCRRGGCAYFLSKAAVLEREFNDPQNIEHWTNAGDPRDLADGLESKKDWHYALSLKNVLERLEPESIHPTYDHLVNNAKSQQFRRALVMSTEALRGTGKDS